MFERFERVEDLGITFDYIKLIAIPVFKTFGFIIRNTKAITNVS